MHSRLQKPGAWDRTLWVLANSRLSPNNRISLGKRQSRKYVPTPRPGAAGIARRPRSPAERADRVLNDKLPRESNRSLRNDGFRHILGRRDELAMVVQETNTRIPPKQHVVVARWAERLGGLE